MDTTIETYVLYKFTFPPKQKDGKLSPQKSERINEYQNIETIFEDAYHMAYTDYRQILYVMKCCGNYEEMMKVRVIPLEYGYEIKSGFQVLARYWIHIKTTFV